MPEPMKLPPGATLVYDPRSPKLPPGATLTPGSPPIKLPPGATLVSSGSNAGGTASPKAPQGTLERLFGKNPISDTLGSVGEHLENFVAGPYHAFTDPVSPQEKHDIEAGGGVADPIGAGLYRMTAEPTVNAFREVQKQWRARNFMPKSDYQENGEYKPSVASSVMDALPVVGPWARSIENEAAKKGALPALAGGAADVAAPYAASKVLRAPRMIKRAAVEAVAPTKVLDAPIPGDKFSTTITPRQRWIDAQKQGVNLDAAQATGATAPAIAKKVTEQSLLGGPKFSENNAANVEALHSHAAAMLDGIAPKMTREDFGNMAQQRLRQHQQMLKDQAGHEDYARAIMDDMSPNVMSREDFGNMAKQKLLEHQQELNGKASDIFEDLTKRVGTKQPNATKVRNLAQQIIDENKDYYVKHPELLKGGPKQAWDIVNDLAGSKPILDAAGKPMSDTWSDLHRLRSDLMDIYRSPDIVGSRPEGWLKQLTGAVDNSMTGASSGLKPGERAKFRQANDIYSQMKGTYDNPQSKLYHVVRAPDGLTAANMLADITPEVARQVTQASTDLAYPELNDQLQRQAVSRLFDPTGSGTIDMDNFGDRFSKVQKEKLGGIVKPVHMEALEDLATKTAERGPYDHPSSKLYKAINAKDGTEAAEALAKVTPESARQVSKAAQELNDPDLVPQLQRQTIERIFNPAENEVPDFKNLPSRFSRIQKEQLGGVLTPDQIDDMEKLARTSGVVNFDSNPSGTAKVLQPSTESGSLAAGAGMMGTGLLTGNPAVVAAGAAPLAATAARGVVASKLVNPATTESLMKPRAPIPPAKLNPVAAVQEAGAIQANAKPTDEDEPAQMTTGTSEGNTGTPPPDKPGMTPLPPAGATHEVLSADGTTVTGHVVDGEYVPLAQ